MIEKITSTKLIKSQIISIKFQINPKLQYPMTKTLKFVCYLDFSIISELERPFIKVIDGCCLRRVQPFRISNFGHWNLFVIWDLLFGIYKISTLEASE